MEKLKNIIISQVPRVLSLLDREKTSQTYGCFDRTYWNYRERDMPNALCQEAVLFLALVYKNNFPGNIYFNNRKIYEWILAAMNFWKKIQNENGSFNEVYKNEYSFASTVFTTYAITESLLILNHFPKEILNSIKKAGQWTIKNSDPGRISNHEAGAVAALHNIYKITGEAKYENAAKKFLSNLKQSAEGWFDEYGGADIGYQSWSIDYLAKYYNSSKNKDALGKLESAVEFISYFMHPDGSAGGEYGSRGMQFLFPHGFTLVSKQIPLASSILKNFLQKLKQTPETVDDRYFIVLLTNYLQTYLNMPSVFDSTKLPCQKNIKKYFSEANLFVISNDFYYAIFSGKGTVSIYSKISPLVFTDCGFIGKIGNKLLTSNWLDKKYDVEFTENQISITGKLHEFKQIFFSPSTLMLFKLFTLTLGKVENISIYLKKKMINRIITKSKTIPVKFQRKISLNKSIRIEDTLEGNVNFDSLLLGGKFSLPYVTFSKYFLPSDLESSTTDLTKKFNSTGKIKIIRTIDMKK